jgi:PIN domain nuclease of toxin-antitoxin system
MRLLLDTHIWLWSIEQPKKIGRGVQRYLRDPRNPCYLSSVSVWETRRLHEKGTLRSKLAFHEWLDEALGAFAVIEVPYSIAIAREALRLRLP